MIKRELKEVTAMRRKAGDLAKAITAASKNGLTEQAKILGQELSALKRSVKDYEERTGPQGNNRKGP